VESAEAVVPAKITLFGEHAVVYGYPALVMAVNLYTSVKAYEGKGKLIRVRSVFPGGRVDSIIDLEGNGGGELPYVKAAIRRVWSIFGFKKPALLDINSQIPSGSGLGSSAAVSVAVLAAYGAIYGSKFDALELARMGREVELEVQGSASLMDALAVTMGGLIRVSPETPRGYKFVTDFFDARFLLAYTKKELSTGAAVQFVRNRKRELGAHFDELVSQIGLLPDKALASIREKDWVRLGKLMDENESYLEELGVVSKRSKEIVNIARSKGALGAKISGGGFGGSVIILSRGGFKDLTGTLKGVSDFTYSVSIAGGISLSTL